MRSSARSSHRGSTDPSTWVISTSHGLRRVVLLRHGPGHGRWVSPARSLAACVPLLLALVAYFAPPGLPDPVALGGRPPLAGAASRAMVNASGPMLPSTPAPAPAATPDPDATGTGPSTPVASPTVEGGGLPPTPVGTVLPVPTPLPLPTGGVSGATSPPVVTPTAGSISDALRGLMVGLCLVVSGAIVLHGIGQERRRLALLVQFGFGPWGARGAARSRREPPMRLGAHARRQPWARARGRAHGARPSRLESPSRLAADLAADLAAASAAFARMARPAAAHLRHRASTATAGVVRSWQADVRPMIADLTSLALASAHRRLDSSRVSMPVLTARRGIAILITATAIGLGACGGSGTTSPAASASPLADAALAAGLKAQFAGNAAAARADYAKVLAADPQNKYAYFDLGLLDQQSDTDPTAEANYRRALAIDPDYTPALFNLAILRTSASPLDAVDLYRHIISTAPKDAKAHLNLGFVLKGLGRDAESQAEIGTALTLDPSLGPPAPAASAPQPSDAPR